MAIPISSGSYGRFFSSSSIPTNKVHRAVNGNNIYNQLLSKDWRCHVAEAAATGDLFAALERRHHGIDFFKIDASGNVLERIKSIGNLAPFLGERFVDAGRFPTIEANCVYFQVSDLAEDGYIYKFSIETFVDGNGEEPKLVSAAMGSNDMVWRTNSARPFTIIQLLCNYTMEIRLPLKWERHIYQKSCGEFDYYDECNYIDYVDQERVEFDW